MRHVVLISSVMLAGCAGSMPSMKPAEGAAVEAAASSTVEPTEPVFSDSPYASTTAMLPVARPADLVIATELPEETAPVEETELPPPPKPEVKPSTLGTTVASLGNPAEPGIWIKTPLVSSRQKGKITAANGKEVVADFIPIDGPATAGSRMSLQAFQALGLPLTDLPEVALSPL